MKDLSIYFTQAHFQNDCTDQKIGQSIISYANDSFPEIEKGGVAIFYVPEFRGESSNQFENKAELPTEVL